MTGDTRREKRRVAVVDDEPDILDLVELHLSRAGFSVDRYADGESFLDSLGSSIPDLVVLDLMLPDHHGTDVCRRIREDSRLSRLPVIMLTALGEETDRVLGLELGADDYVTKPFSPRELVARVRAVLRRAAGTPEQGGVVSAGGRIQLDVERYTTTVDGREVDLTPTEFRILRILAQGKGRVYSRAQLLEMLWEGEKFVFERTIDVHIRHIREKLGEASEMIQNVRGVGYKLDARE
jgi:DNA-binding response OmpR family regulator